MKHSITFALLLLSLASLQAEEITTTLGKKITGTVSRVEPNGIVVETDSGIEKVPFEDLTAADQKRFNYDPAQAQTFTAEQQRAKAALAARGQAGAVAEARQKAALLAPSVSPQPMKKASKKSESSTTDPFLTEHGKGLQKFVKMTVTQVAANSFSLEGSLVELSGIRSVDITETAKGVYAVTIWGADGYLRSTVPAGKEGIVERAKTLYVSVSEASSSGARVKIHGNATTHRGLSVTPTAFWK